MNLDERLNKSNKPKTDKDPYYAEEPDWMIYKNAEKQPFLNENEGVFALKDRAALNTAPSVFESTAVFKTDIRQAR